MQTCHSPKLEFSTISQYGDAKPINWNMTAPVDNVSAMGRFMDMPISYK
jgi:hypothetical protein